MTAPHSKPALADSKVRERTPEQEARLRALQKALPEAMAGNLNTKVLAEQGLMGAPATTLISSAPKDEAEWTLDEWRTHALRLRKRLRELEAKQQRARGKPTVRSKSTMRITTLATAKPSPRWDKAWDVLRIRQEMQTTVPAALREWYRREGKRVPVNLPRTVINDVGELRKRLVLRKK